MAAPHDAIGQPPHSNVYVRNISPHVDEPYLRSLFEPYGLIDSLRLVPNKTVGGSAYAFINYTTIEAAQNAIAYLNSYPVHGVALEVKLANAPVAPHSKPGAVQGVPNDNLYVTHIPVTYTEERIVRLFQQHGIVLSCKLLTGHKQHDPGVGYTAMVRMGSVDEATRAIHALNASMLPEGTTPLAVKYADTPEQKALRKTRTMTMARDPPPRYHPYGAGAPRHAQPAAPPANSYAPQPVQELHFAPQPQHMAPGQLPQQHPATAPQHGPPPHSSALNGHHGPPGAAPRALPATASIYINNLPAEADKLYLYETFAPLGAIRSVKTMVNNQTGLCTGVGFVNFIEPEVAAQAVEMFNGSTAGNQVLYVALQPAKALRAAGYS